jgi:hypothetical protein
MALRIHLLEEIHAFATNRQSVLGAAEEKDNDDS